MGCDLSKLCPIFFKSNKENGTNINGVELHHYERLYEQKEENSTNEVSFNYRIIPEKELNELTDVKINLSKLVLENKCNPSELYEMIAELGKGAYGQVCKVKHKKTGKLRAMKVITKAHVAEGMNYSLIEKEINILKGLDHPNVVKIFEFFQDDFNYYILTELCEQGDLFDKLRKSVRLNENSVMLIMHQLLSSVAYLHSKSVIHGDLKLENILVDRIDSSRASQSYSEINFKNSQTECVEIKLIDFGCAKIFSKGKLHGVIGTSLYCAPEVIENTYNEKCDVWACGVIMSYLLSGFPPFDGDTDEEIFSSIKTGKIDFNFAEFENVSKSAKDLITKLLTFKYATRPSAKAALKHSFFDDYKSRDDKLDINLHLDPSIMNSLMSVKSTNKFHQAVVAYISHNFANQEEVAKLRNLFKFLDKNGDGTICRAELLQGCKAFNNDISESSLNSIISAMDNDNSGLIEYEEFLRSLLAKETLLTDTNLKMAFDLFDLDRSGSISCEEIKEIIFGDQEVTDKIMNEFLAQINKTPTDLIDFEDFKKLMIGEESE